MSRGKPEGKNTIARTDYIPVYSILKCPANFNVQENNLIMKSLESKTAKCPIDQK